MSSLREAIRQEAKERGWYRSAQGVYGPEAMDAAIEAALFVIRQRIEALRYEARRMDGGNDAPTEPVEWLWRDAVLRVVGEEQP